MRRKKLLATLIAIVLSSALGISSASATPGGNGGGNGGNGGGSGGDGGGSGETGSGGDNEGCGTPSDGEGQGTGGTDEDGHCGDHENKGCGAEGSQGTGGLGDGEHCDDGDDEGEPADEAPPTITSWAFSGTPGTSPWYTSGGDISVECTDAVDGDFDGSADPASLSADGIHAVVLTCTDDAGNTATQAVTVRVDATAPVITDWDFSGMEGTNGWYTSSGTVTVECSDNMAGEFAGSAAPWMLTTDGIHSVTLSCTDPAGNTTTQSATVKVDATAPVITGWAFSGSAGNNGWYRSSGTVTVACTDNLDANPSGSASPPTLAADGEHSVILSCTDHAGNTALGSATVKIDKTPPTITWSGDGNYDVDQMIGLSCAAADTTSLIATTTCPAAAVSDAAYNHIGSNSASASASDNAGNSTNNSTTYRVIPTTNGSCSVMSQLVTNAGVANSLCMKLRSSQAAAARGQATAELNLLSAFDKEVTAQTGKHITASHASVLKDISAFFRTN